MTYAPNELVSLRRDLHAHPELSHDEARTAAVVADRIRALGLAPQVGVAGHGVVAVLEGSKPGPTLLFRADMDALPIQEIAGRAYGSTSAGVMHACGHDVHTTIGVGVAAALVARRDEIHGRIKFVFQPAEEAAPGPGEIIGAERMVQEGVLSAPNVDAAFALHVMPTLDVGNIGYTGGSVWAASDLFDIEIKGKMTHGAYPHEGIDPVYCAAQMIQALQQIPSRNVDARSACVISVCRVNSGTAYNVVPDRAHMQGLVRTLDAEVRQKVMARFEEVVAGIAAACGCEAELVMRVGARLTANDPELEAFARQTCSTMERPIPLVSMQPQMGAEDFAAFSTRVPSCYLYLGVRNEAKGIVHMIHTPNFDVDESCLPLGVQAMTETLLAAGRNWKSLSARLAPGASERP